MVECLQKLSSQKEHTDINQYMCDHRLCETLEEIKWLYSHYSHKLKCSAITLFQYHINFTIQVLRICPYE